MKALNAAEDWLLAATVSLHTPFLCIRSKALLTYTLFNPSWL